MKNRSCISWNLTKNCNLKCKHCYINAKEEKEQLTTEQCFNLIEQIAELGNPMLILSGGEPLLRKDIYEIASYCKKKIYLLL